MIYQNFLTTDIVAGRTHTVSSGFFDGNFTASQSSSTLVLNPTQTASFGTTNYDIQNGLYYWDVLYNNKVYFSLAYGDMSTSSSAQTDIDSTKIFPFMANYKSYANLLLAPSETYFSFLQNDNTAVTSPYIFIINFSADLYKGQIDPGKLEFSLTAVNLSGNTSSITLIDDSTLVNKTSNVYNIIQGSIDSNGIATQKSGGSYEALGLFYPKNGIVILNASAIASVFDTTANQGDVYTMYGKDSTGVVLGFNSETITDSPLPNAFKTFQSCLYNSIISSSGKSMKIRNSELIPTTQYYVRVQNANFNYTNNPTFISDGTGVTEADKLPKGTIKIPELRTNPTTYITTVGLYNDVNELVAVAKLSQPIPKNFDNEYLLKVNLQY